MEDDSFDIIVRASNALALIPVNFHKESNRYCSSSRFFLIINIAFYVLVQIYNQTTNFYVPALTVSIIIYIIDNHIFFCFNYCLALNGVLHSKAISKFLNLLRSVRQQNRLQFGGPRYTELNKTWLVLTSLVLRHVIHCVFHSTVGIISTTEEMLMEVLCSMLAISGDTYFVLINAILIVLRAELRHVYNLLAHAKPVQVRQLFKAHMDVLALMQLFTKCFATPVLYCVFMLFYDGTQQLFQCYVVMATSHDDYSVMEVVYYVSWYVPLVAKLIITMHLAASISELVSVFFSYEYDNIIIKFGAIGSPNGVTTSTISLNINVYGVDATKVVIIICLLIS